MQSVIERLKVRKRIGSTVEVKFLPGKLYQHYIDSVLQPGIKPHKRKAITDLTESERAQAEAAFHELTFTFNVLAGEERRKWEREAMKAIRAGDQLGDAFFAYVTLKLREKFVEGKHEPKNGSAPVTVDAAFFDEFLAELDNFELIDLKNLYYNSQLQAMRQAEGNGNIAAPDGGAQ